MSTRTMLAFLLLALICSFLRGFLALGPAGVIWHLTELGPLPVTQSAVAVHDNESGLSRLVDLNSAGIGDLQVLPGIGPTLAARIIEYRKSIGGFRDFEELLEVKGIGEAKLRQVRPLITVGITGE